MIEHIEVLVEEPSAEAALSTLLPRFLHDVTYAVYPYNGKDDLLKKLPERLRGYSKWLPDNWRLVVLLDRDNVDCLALKRQLNKIGATAGMAADKTDVRYRIAIEELEAWYFGDWQAVREAYPRVSGSVPTKSRYRDPDAITGGTWEALEKVLQAGGYMKGGLRKREVARAVCERLQPDRSISRSFRVFWNALTEGTTAG